MKPFLRSLTPSLSLLTAVLICASSPARAQDAHRHASKIEHVIVVVGENHTFDNIFGVYRPRHGQVKNLLSQGIVKADGSPGRHFSLAAQSTARGGATFSLDPQRTGAYSLLPQPNTTYATGVPGNVPDTRFPANLPNGPFQITRYVSTADYTGDPVHRFFQMSQQLSKGKHDLFVWTAQTMGIGNFNDGFGFLADDTFQGGEGMGFYNLEAGDLPDFKRLADTYAISDNYHQSILGGTGANFIALVSGSAAFYNVAGQRGPAIKPYSVPVPAAAAGPTGAYVTSTIENPDPQPGAPLGNTNWPTDDGYAGGSYVKCADRAQPGVSALRDYLDALHVPAKCEADTYYLVNNFNPYLNRDGTAPTPAQFAANPFRLPTQPASARTIADSLQEAGVSWKYYSGGRTDGTGYCSICDPLTHYASVMGDPAKKARLVDQAEFFTDAKGSSFPAVAFVRPLEDFAGHPANSTVAAYEAFVVQLVEAVKANRELWAHTVIFVTVDEGGGYYDSGSVQPVDFFGDGTRVPLLAISPWVKRGHVDHAYADHASVLKFIDWNWKLAPVSGVSRDALPNPVAAESDPYVPTNGPAISDLRGLFDFHDGHDDHDD